MRIPPGWIDFLPRTTALCKARQLLSPVVFCVFCVSICVSETFPLAKIHSGFLVVS